MKKKVLSVITSVAVLGSLACASAVSSSAFSGEIKFEVTDNLARANKTFYAHIWNGLPGGQGLYQWQTKDEKMTWKSGDATATYNVPEGDWNLIIISSNTGFQTYDTVFNANCIGDTCYVMDETFENPVDSTKSAKGLGWRNNPDCGPHIVISSLGNVIGSAYLPGETNQNLYDGFVKKYDINNVSNGDDLLNWNDPGNGQQVTGKDWETIKKEVAEKLGVQTSSSEEPTEAATSAPASSSDSGSSSNTNTSSNSGSSSNTSSSSSSSSGSTSTTGTSTTTTTGDTTPVVGLFATLAGALGVVFLARKKATK